jgi:4,5-DOPA dioxygenase extradiol
VVQLSINGLQPLGYHVDLGTRLAPLRREGVLIVGSGNVVHNLRRIDWNRPSGGFDWTHRFDDDATALMQERPGDILSLVDHRDFDLAVPTPDHFIPLLYIAALAAAAGDTTDVLVAGPAYGSISMTSHALGADHPAVLGQTAAADLPGPAGAPPDQANI